MMDRGERSSPGVSILHRLYVVARSSTSMLREVKVKGMMMSADLEGVLHNQTRHESTEHKARQVQRTNGVYPRSHLVSFPGLWTFLPLSLQSLA